MKICQRKPSFLTQVAALSGQSSGYEIIPPADSPDEHIYWAACVHHCGAAIRCATRIHVVQGRVVRITSDDDELDFKGDIRDKEMWTDTRALACGMARAYKFRLYHPGRLKYALMQTKERGDLSGFVKVSPSKALNDIARKYRAIFGKYGAGAIFETDAPGAQIAGTYNKCHPAREALTNFIGGTKGYYYDYSFHQFHYAQNITGFPDIPTPWHKGIGEIFPDIAGVAKNLVLWGSNTLTTGSSIAYAYMRTVELMKERCAKEGSGGGVWHISPELNDTGVTLATEWVQVRNYTDVAMIMAMFYEMIVSTFDEHGNILPNPMLDIDYLDTMVYGFFDSPEYYIMTNPDDPRAGEISLEPRYEPGWVKIDAVPPGASLSAYVMGTDTRLQKAGYNAGNTYTSRKFATKTPYRNMASCTVKIKGQPACMCDQSLISSIYRYKKEIMLPKTPEWAEKICGTPAATIRNLARMYCNPNEHPIVSEWSGGLQKHDNGVPGIWAIQALMCITKTFGITGEGLYGSWATMMRNSGEIVKETLNPSFAIPEGRPEMAKNFGDVPAVSIKEWFNSVKLAFYEDLMQNGYTNKYIPNWDMKERFLYDDAGAKTGVVWKRDKYGNMIEYMDPETNMFYYDYVRDPQDNTKPLYSGTRMIINPSGAMQLNQHANTNDSSFMYRNLPLASADPDDPDTYCFVTFDNFLTPSSRYADYVLPATVSLEAGDWAPVGGIPMYRPPVAPPPGEAMDGWQWTYLAYMEQTKLGDFTAHFGDRFTYHRKVDPDAHLKYVGTANTTRKYQSAEDISMQVVDEARTNPNSRFYGMTRQEVFAEQFQPRANQEPAVTKHVVKSNLRAQLDSYLALPEEQRVNTPFVYNGYDTWVTASAGEIGNREEDIAEDLNDRPKPSGKFHIYNMMCVWDYEHRFSKYHGWLPKERRGQLNADREGDPMVLPIPIYWNFQDSFNEAYGVFDGKNNEITNGLTLGTTHDRFRAHSSMAENPFLRELNHRTAGGGWASGNDWGEYATSKTSSVMISQAVHDKNIQTASWHELWINREDAESRNIQEGDLIQLENPVGAVRVIARLTDRCVRGHVNLHQGAWYDPNPEDGVDDGGCANTLMSSHPSRYDHGNAQQMALVEIKKVEGFFHK